MAHKTTNRRKFSLLTSTALTKQVAALGALGVVFGANSAFALDPNALPQDPNVVGGGATFNSSGATLTVNQSTNRTVIDWRSFDIGSNATTNFVQPGASAIAVNRVNASANPTQIQGHLNANGQVWILNPNGVLFGKTAKIDVAGIIASTGNIDTAAFMRGDNRLQFTGGDGGTVDNAGLISVADGGLAAFVAPSVRNSGIIRARVGKVTLAAGTTFTLDLAGDQLVELGLGANNAIVDQSGQVLADGSVVNITAKAASAVVDSVINISGTVLASSVSEDGGTITLSADNITTASSAALKADAGANGDGGTIYAYADKLGKYDGTFSAKGGSASGDGGFVETSGKKVQIADGISVNTLAANGKTGDWTIDPDDLVIGGVGADIATSTVVDAMNNTGMTLTANNSITVNDKIDSSAQTNANTLALNDENTDNNLTINLNDKITLGSHQHLTGQGTTVNVANTGLIQNGVDVAMAGGATVNVAAGTYNENITINKSGLSLLSNEGRDVTTIIGQNGGAAQGAVYITSGANNFTLGDINHGFTIIGLNGTAASERSAIYFQGANSGSTIRGNRVTAAGDEAILTEYGGTVANLTIDSNTIDGVTFVQPTAGNGAQFVADNVPRGLVYIAGAGGANKTNIVFTNNDITGTAGGYALDGSQSGNTLVTIDAAGATITGNTFAGTTTKWADALRARGSDTVISGNTFDGTNMTSGTNMVEVNASTLSGTFAELIANNTWNNGSAWVDHAVGGVYYVFRGIQSAIGNATAGDTVHAGAGVYSEALNIDKNVDLVGAGVDETIIRPDALLSTGAAHKYDSNVKATVYVHDAADVNISGVTIDGNNLGNNAIVFWNNASGSISDAVIKNAAPFSGIQTGQGLALDASTGKTSNLDLTNVAFENWNKNAIDVVTSGGDATLDVVGSSFTGAGTTGTIAQNGILLWERAGGTINATVDGSSFSDIDYTGADTATGILVYGSPNATLSVSNSTFDDVKNYIATSGATGSDVDATSGNTFDGVSLAGATLQQIYAIEDKIEDGLDDAASGLVRLVANNVYVTQQSGSIQAGVFVASVGDTIHVQAGDYDGGIAVNKQGLTLTGDEGVTVNVIPVSNGQLNGFDITANDVTLQGFDIAGEISGSYLTYAFDNTVSRGVFVYNGVTNFNVTGNNIHDVRTGVVIDGRNTGSLTNNVIDNTKSAVSVQYTDAGVGNTEGYSVTMTGNSEGAFGNEWGVNVHLNGHQDGVGGLLPNGTKIAADAPSSVQAALLANSAANGGWSVQDQGYSYSNRTGVYVDTAGSASNQGSQRGPLNSINDGIKAVVSGGTVHVNDGTYVIASGGGNYLHITKSLNLIGQSEAGTIIDARNASSYGIRVQADDVTLSDFTLWGSSAASSYGIKVEPLAGAAPIDPNLRINDLTIENVAITGSTKTGLDLNGVNGATINNVTVSNTANGNGIALTDSANVTITNSTTTNNAWGGLALYQTNSTYNQQVNNISVDGTNTFNEANSIYAQDQSATNDFGIIDLAGQGIAYVAKLATGGGDGDYTFFQKLKQGAYDIADAFNTRYVQTGATVQGYAEADKGVNGDSTFHVGHASGGNALSINAAVANATTGGTINVDSGIYGEDVTVGSARKLSFDGSTLNSYTQTVASAIGGTVTAVNGFFLNAATTLLSDTVLNGAVTAQSIDGSTAGGQALTINGGSNAVALGNLGATTRLGATNVTGTTSLNGSVYKANALTFNGPATLTQALTTFDTSAAGGNVTFTGNIFGTADGAQSVAFTTGSGDISLQNAGTDSIWLGDMSVVGDDFSAATVYAATYVSLLTGNQTFTSTTLHTRGAVNSSVGGNANGPIVSGGDVNVTTGGDFNGNVNAPSGTISGTNITGTFTGNTFTFVASNSVDLTTNANSINVSSPSGTVDGTFSTINNSGGSIVVNGQTRTGNSETNPNQIVVEGYTLPAGAIVTSSGEIVLPNGLVIGLISPQAGGGAPGSKPKVVVVHSVQKLGELLAQGYVAIIIDLSKNNDDQEELALAD